MSVHFGYESDLLKAELSGIKRDAGKLAGYYRDFAGSLTRIRYPEQANDALERMQIDIEPLVAFWQAMSAATSLDDVFDPMTKQGIGTNEKLVVEDINTISRSFDSNAKSATLPAFLPPTHRLTFQ